MAARFAFAFSLILVVSPPSIFGQPVRVSSPGEAIKVDFWVTAGTPYYKVEAFGRPLMRQSALGFTLKRQPPLGSSFEIADASRRSVDETWEQPWGEQRFIRNHFNELNVLLSEPGDSGRSIRIVFRVYDDGVGFRYEFPEQPNLGYFEIMDEHTEFWLASPKQAWWIPAYRDNRYEYLYTRSSLARMDTVHTPVTFETEEGHFVSIHEANLTDFSSMTIANKAAGLLKADLVPWRDGTKVKVMTPHVSPWRTIQIARSPGELITSYLILNLNEPSRLTDTSWITPGKYVGIWWGMHIDLFTWEAGPRHGATTPRAREYIDFAAKNGFIGVLVEGWNRGWGLGDWVNDALDFSFTEPYPDFDLQGVARYAASKGTRLIGHHETAAGIANYERQAERAFELYKGLGVRVVKTGYVGKRVDGGEWHHGQFMVRHYRKIVELAAQKGIMLDVHEPIKDTGIRRTWPNMMTREGARGMEYNAWSEEGGNPPEHTVTIPFTRMLSGPFDMTPGIFDHHFPETRPNNRVPSTLARQLAYYVVIYSPLHMAADLPVNYRNNAAFQFIRDVPTDWETTRVLHAKIGDYVTIARKDRNSEDWYLGSITDEDKRSLEAPLDFLEPGRPYVAHIYADGTAADYRTNPLDMNIATFLVNSDVVLDLGLAPGGGQAIRFFPASDEDVQRLQERGKR
jgi:alpha-glucosidase